MSINNLSISKSAQFYKLNKALSISSINDAFRKISKGRVGNYLFKEVKVPFTTDRNNKAVYSLVSYKVEVEPSFLIETSIKEQKFAYLLLIEFDDALAILKKHVDSLDKYFSKFIEDFDYDKFCHFHGRNTPEYERVTMKNMNISNAVIRSRSLEAKSLNGLVSSNSSSRSIPSNFRMKIGLDVYTLTPNTSRISHRDKKANFSDLVDWLIETKNEIKTTTNSSEFLNNFASPICLNDIICKGHSVVAILFDLSEIEKKVEVGTLSLEKVNGSGLRKAELNRLFNIFRSPIMVDGDRLRVKGVLLDGKITLSKNLITIKNKIVNDIVIQENGLPSYTLGSYINKEKPFSAVFDSPNYSYYSKSCFEDKSLLNNIQSILNVFDDSYDFNNVESEKEKPHSSLLTRFPDTSLFRVIEDEYCKNHNVVICDDMNDEWADHIAIDHNSSIPSLVFIHSKFSKKETYGASAFHDVVAQALKNIGRTQSDKSLFKAKYKSEWHKNYESTKIKRVSGAKDWSDIEKALDSVFRNPNSIKKIVLATPFLKKGKLKIELDKLAQGKKCRPHYIQLIWLINTFIGSCKEYGVQAHILCKP